MEIIENLQVKLIMNEFKKLKVLIDKLPNTFNLNYSEENGYLMEVDLDNLKSNLSK